MGYKSYQDFLNQTRTPEQKVEVKEKKKRKDYERKLQIACKQWFDWALPDVLAFHSPQEFFGGADRERAIIQVSLLKKQGFMAGVADWLMFWRGQKGAIELKSIGGKLSESQEIWRDKWIKTGGLYAKCDSMPQVEEAVKSWGLKPLYPAPRVLVQTGKQMAQNAMFEWQKPL